MGESSKIEWTDATVNFWWGCTKVGPGCDHCYAETWAKRTGGNLWGVGAQRRKIKSAAALIHRLDNGYADWAADAVCMIGNAKAFGLPIPNIGHRRRVFIQSMSDLFDLEVPLEWFAEAWGLIESCNRIAVQIVTKRVSAVAKRLAQAGCTKWPHHAGLMITVVNQDEAERDIPRLLALTTQFDIPWIGLSIEPMLGAIDLSRWIDAIDWVICGGESGSKARPMHPAWPKSLRDQCAAADVPFLYKQWGSWKPLSEFQEKVIHSAGKHAVVRENGAFTVDTDIADPPRDVFTFYMGKKGAGRLLDGIEHNGFPEVRA